jgi:ppGpp synthetase/RelA/SpoT-type nucleotidyltranferase
MPTDMSLKEIEAWLELKIENLQSMITEANEKSRIEVVAELIKSESRLVAKLADVRVTGATIH